jgi:serine/threonine protein kinase
MSYPSLEQYQTALQHPHVAFVPASLKSGKIALSGLGQPRVMCGGFALTYAVTVGSSRFAVRCFHRQSPDLEQRYRAISTQLERLASKYFVQFKFEPQGVRVDGSVYPIVQMQWSEGDTLGVFLSDNFKKRAKIEALRKAFVQLAGFLESHGIAHGDIQPGNVMVGGQGTSLTLIDYDGMFVPAIQSLKAAEIGHRNFQHPERAKAGFGPTLDRFSLISVYVALRAIEAEPKVWEDTQSDYDAFVFRAADFEDPGTSVVFRRLRAISALASDVNAFAAVCASRFDQTPTLADFMASRNIPVPPLAARPRPLGEPAYISQYSVLNASDFGAFQRAVGTMVELIGEIVEVAKKKTKHGRPYIFVNFGHWRGNIVKLTIWSETLAKMTSHPTASWVGKWVTVVGLVETYTDRKKYGYTHLSIDITSQNQLKILSSEEVRFRLRARSGGAAQSNRAVMDRMRGNAAPGGTIGTQRAAPPASSNAAILHRMKSVTGSSPAPPQRVSSQSHQKVQGIGSRILRFLGFK